MNNNSNQDTMKIVIIGDGGVGKSSFAKRYIHGEFEKHYNTTVGVEVHPLTFYTNLGMIKFDLWDTAGQEKFGGLRDGYYIGCDAAIIMFDITSRTSYKNVNTWYKDLVRVTGVQIPIVLVGNKVDMKDRKVKPKNITFHRKKGIQYYDLSVKTNYNIEKPFVYLMKRLFKDNDLCLVETPSIIPPEHSIYDISEEQLKIYEEELERAMNTPLDDDIDDF
eukprot:TRINITY_DN3157_c1_g1_i1.p1 TRINITY_DN3157_c1_g1~~TRINITY_DN3157_c1_g1_i1.p1  ORF type:complete len:220 (+),score=61.58 TRINITY_DN3157_c1_g1_i1:231-890(+)